MQEEPIKVQRSRDSESLRAACGHEGCPVCTVRTQHLERSIDNWEYDGFSDVAHRYELIHSRGFCPLHTWQLAQRNNAFRLGLIYNEILTDVEQKLENDYRRLVAADDSAPKHEPVLKRWQRKWFHRGDETSMKSESPRSTAVLSAVLARMLNNVLFQRLFSNCYLKRCDNYSPSPRGCACYIWNRQGIRQR